MATVEDVCELANRLGAYTDQGMYFGQLSIYAFQFESPLEFLADAMRSALLRISPEKTTAFVEARRHINTVLVQSSSPQDLGQIFPIGLIDSLL